jgi:predicted O-methyltransferase YrrM
MFTNNNMRDLRGLIINEEYDQGGWCYDEKRNFIHTLINLTNSKVCVEIGVYKGSSLFSFAEVLEQIGGTIIGIDPWSFDMSINEIPDKNYENYIYNELLKGQETFDFLYKNVCEIIQNNDLSKTISLIKEPSQDVFINFNNESIDILHIDGNHNEMNVSRDILLYAPLVKKGGYIIMDDSNWESVKSAINKFLTPNFVLIQDFKEFSCYIKK